MTQEMMCPLREKGCKFRDLVNQESSWNKCSIGGFQVCDHRYLVQMGYGTDSFRLDVYPSMRFFPRRITQ